VTVTRRLAVILAADAVGYSRLMGEDEAGTALSVRAHREAARPIVAGFGGRIVKTTGDGFLLEFASVVAAVECAIAVQKLMVERNAETPEAKKIVYRIGVNLGDVLIEGDDILGGGVNIAARPQGFASRAVCWCQAPLTNRRAAGSTRNLSISARRNSRISRGRCGPRRLRVARRARCLQPSPPVRPGRGASQSWCFRSRT
jgi:class 3 adenylate cyclase